MDNIERFFTGIDCIITDGSEPNNIGYSLPEPSITVDPNNIMACLNTIMNEQSSHNILIITESECLCDICLTMNKSITKRKLAVVCCGRLYADDAIAEMIREEQLLHTVDGREFFPEKQLGSTPIFKDENNALLLHSDGNGERLFSADGSVWGCVLDSERYSADAFSGILSDNLAVLDLKTRAAICLELLDMYEADELIDLEQIVLFNSEDGISLLTVGAAIHCSVKELSKLLYTVYFGHEVQKDKLEMLIADRLAFKDHPSYLFEDFVQVFSDSIYPSSKFTGAGAAQFRSTANRILLAV